MNKVAPERRNSLIKNRKVLEDIKRASGKFGADNKLETSDRNGGSKTKLTSGAREVPSITNVSASKEASQMRAILPQIVNEQNRKTYGTWQNQFDFTRTIIGYLLGIHNFFRFPYLCYKYGGVFFIPYVVMMVLVGVPVVFMEFTIGQYCGVGFYIAFTHMAPVLSGVSKLLTWSCVVNCWMYTVIMAYIRIYSNDSTSCLKAWEVCNRHFYYNTPHCFTGASDDDCNDPRLARNVSVALTQDMIYYNFACRPVEYYCNAHGWKLIPGRRKCIDANGRERSIYERRYHATAEFFYGAVSGLQRKMELKRREYVIAVTRNVTGRNIQDIRVELRTKHNYHRWNISSDEEIIRIFLLQLDEPTYERIVDIVGSDRYQKEYWNDDGRKLVEDEDSSSYVQIQELSTTTWIMIAVFLFEDLLTVSLFSYALNAVPFIVLIYVTVIAVSFPHSGNGIKHLVDNQISDLLDIEIWTEAVIQVIYTTGIGNGVLISLATFNNFNHSFMNDLFSTLGLTLMTSCCGVLICFCSLGHYLAQHKIDVRFEDYIKSESVSSVEFAFIVYSHFLTLITEKNVVIILFYFMLTSFITDTAIRLAQGVLDTLATVSPRLKYHSTMVLIAVCIMGYLLLVPIMKNGGIVLFIDFEYFSLRYMIPGIILVEVGATIFVYTAKRVVDNAEQMEVFATPFFRTLITSALYISFVLVLLTLITNVIYHKGKRFNGEETERFETFGWVFFISPLLMATLSVIKHFIVVPRERWWWLFIPLLGKDRRIRRAFLRRIQGGNKKFDRREDGRTDHEAARAAALRWRILEARLLQAVMQKRKEEQAKKQRASYVEQTRAEESRHSQLEHQIPLLHTLVRVTAEADAKTKANELAQREYADRASHPEEAKEKASTKRRLKSASFFKRVRAAFLGRAVQGDHTQAKRHVGAQPSRIGNRSSGDQKRSNSLSEENENHSIHDSATLGEDRDKNSLVYLDILDYVERWPGRLDEDEIESEGSSVAESETDDEEQ